MKTILLVDDDAPMRTVLSKSLARAGYHVIEAGDGKEALKLFNESPTDLVVTDLIMPETEGVEIISNLRRRHPPVSVIAISGGGRNSPENYLAIAKALGAAEILAKPFLPEKLVAAVEIALKQPS